MTKTAFQVLAAQQFDQTDGLPTEIELLQVGDWQTPWKGHIVNTAEDLQAMVTNFNSGEFQPDNKLPINIDHYKQEAVGWIYGLEVRGNSLWGTGIEWTEKGQQLLAAKEYAYLSSEWSPMWQDPLDEEHFVENVFEGAAITNYPLFNALQPLVANRKQKKELTENQKTFTLYMKGSVMNLKDLLAKDVKDLSDEEKQFIVDNKSELTEEQVTTLTESGVLEAEGDDPADPPAGDPEGDPDEDPEDPPADPVEDKNTATISASKLRKLQADAKKGVEAAHKMHVMEATAKTEKMIITASNKDGRFLEASKDDLNKFYLSLSASQKTQFDNLVEKLPKLNLATRQSVADEGKGAGAVAEMEAKIKEHQASSKKDNGKVLSYMEARRVVLKENADLNTRVKEELNEGNGE